MDVTGSANFKAHLISLVKLLTFSSEFVIPSFLRRFQLLSHPIALVHGSTMKVLWNLEHENVWSLGAGYKQLSERSRTLE